MRTTVESIREMATLLESINAMKTPTAGFPMADAIDVLLEVRSIARRCIEATSSGEPSSKRVRLVMALVELHVNDFIRAQPESSGDEDQRLLDAITGPLNALSTDLEELERPPNAAAQPIH